MTLYRLHRKNKELDAMDPISVDSIDIVEDWVMEKEESLREYESSDWWVLAQPAVNTLLALSPNDEAEGFAAGNISSLI